MVLNLRTRDYPVTGVHDMHSGLTSHGRRAQKL